MQSKVANITAPNPQRMSWAPSVSLDPIDSDLKCQLSCTYLPVYFHLLA